MTNIRWGKEDDPADKCHPHYMKNLWLMQDTVKKFEENPIKWVKFGIGDAGGQGNVMQKSVLFIVFKAPYDYPYTSGSSTPIFAHQDHEAFSKAVRTTIDAYRDMSIKCSEYFEEKARKTA
jgi:hypothetical protein